MKRFMMIAMAGVLVLSGCAANDTDGQRQAQTLDRADPPLGSLIKRKPGSTGPSNTGQVDLQALENARTMGNGTMSVGK